MSGNISLPNSIFISYSRKDKDLVIPVVKAQEELAITAFIDYEDTPAGVDWEDEHDFKIETSQRFVLCWSRNSAASPNVEREWRLALDYDVYIIPVLLDDTPLHQDLAHLQAIDMTEYVKIECRPTPFDAGLHGAFVLGIASLILIYQIFLISNHDVTVWRLMLSALSGLLAYKGWRMICRWKDWLRLKSFVDRIVISDAYRGDKRNGSGYKLKRQEKARRLSRGDSNKGDWKKR